MFFNKEKNNVKCAACNSKCNNDYSFCPHCGTPRTDAETEMRDFGMLGKNDVANQPVENTATVNLGFTDRILDSLVNSMMRSLDKQMRAQMKDMDKAMENAEIRTTPHGIRIKIGPTMAHEQEQQQTIRALTNDQAKRMSSLPRAKALTSVKRIGDKIVYELTTPEVNSPADVFISKLETGYEIKAIGDTHVYVNSIPLNLPIKKYSLAKNKLLFEFSVGEQ